MSNLTHSQSTNSTGSFSDSQASLIERVLNSLQALYAHKFMSAFSTQAELAQWRKTWSMSLQAEKLTRAELERGMQQCRTKFDWPPSFAEFYKACRPVDNKIERTHASQKTFELAHVDKIAERAKAAEILNKIRADLGFTQNRVREAIKDRHEGPKLPF